MVKKVFFIFCLLSISFYLNGDEEQFENKQVVQINIEARDLSKDSSFQSKIVENKLKTKVGEPFSQSTFDQDLKNLAKDYDRVDPQIKLKNNEVYVTLKVWLRPLIKNIDWKGSFHFNKNKLQKELGIHPHTIFNRYEFNRAFHKLKEFYIKKGYFEVQLSYNVVKDPFSNEITLEINIEEGKSGLIEKVEFEGFTAQEIRRLKEIIHISKYNVFLSWYTHRGVYHEELMDYEKLEVLRFLRNEGYANAKVELIVRESIQKNRIAILIKADKGKRYQFGGISFDGNKDFDDPTIKDLICIQEGSPYSPKNVQDTVAEINQFYGKKGYIDASVTYDLHLIDDKSNYSVNFKIDEGEPYKVGLIKVLGNHSTQSKVILHETLLEPGNTFNTGRLEATQKRLENIGYYKHVNVYASSSTVAQNIGAPIRDVNIEVDETSTGQMGLFAGFSSLDNVFGGLEVTEKNFNLAGILQIPSRGITALRGAGEYLRIKTSLGLKLDDYSINWTKNYFLDTPWTVGVNINKNFNRLQSDNYKIESFTTNVRAFYPLNAFLNFSLYYQMKNLKLHVDGGSPKSLFDAKDNNGIVSAVGFSFLYNSTNHPFRSTKGFASEFDCEYSGVGGDFFYFKFIYDNSYYIPITKRIISKTRADFSFIIPIDPTTPEKMPMGERLFLVGELSSVRGFRPYAIGPHFDSFDRDPEGGISVALLSQEFLFNILPGFDVFAYIDSGSLSMRRFDINVLRTAVGVGARISALSSLPLMLGWGYPINPENRDRDTESFFITMGGKF